jgi:hypothetical protein
METPEARLKSPSIFQKTLHAWAPLINFTLAPAFADNGADTWKMNTAVESPPAFKNKSLLNVVTPGDSINARDECIAISEQWSVKKSGFRGIKLVVSNKQVCGALPGNTVTGMHYAIHIPEAGIGATIGADITC